MKLNVKSLNIKIILLYFLIFSLVAGGTYALTLWNSTNTTISGNTLCFDILYTKGQDIDFGTVNTSGIVENGMTAALAFNTNNAASTEVAFARQNGCTIHGIGTITVNLTSSIDLSKGGLKYRVVKKSTSAVVSKGSITSTGKTVIYENFDIINSTTYVIYFWLDANYIDNSYLEATYSGTIEASAISRAAHDNMDMGNTLSVGDYVSYTPTLTSYTTSTAYTGYTSTQTINPSELNLWRVLNINSDGTVEIISEYISSVDIYFRGKEGYQNFVGYLNELASKYETSGITESSRHFGYNGQTEYITTSSMFKYPAPWTSSTGNNTIENQGGGDTLYTNDYNKINTALGTKVANRIGTTTPTIYWVASRYYIYSGATTYYWDGRRIESDGSNNSKSFYSYYNTGFTKASFGAAIRPIVTLKASLRYGNQAGTSSNPIQIIID